MPKSLNDSRVSTLPSHLAHLTPREAFVQIMEPLCNPQLPPYIREYREDLMVHSDAYIDFVFQGTNYEAFERAAEDGLEMLKELNSPAPRLQIVAFSPK